MNGVCLPPSVPGIAIAKTERIGTGGWSTTLTGKVGETVQYRIIVYNTGQRRRSS